MFFYGSRCKRAMHHNTSSSCDGSRKTKDTAAAGDENGSIRKVFSFLQRPRTVSLKNLSPELCPANFLRVLGATEDFRLRSRDKNLVHRWPGVCDARPAVNQSLAQLHIRSPSLSTARHFETRQRGVLSGYFYTLAGRAARLF